MTNTSIMLTVIMPAYNCEEYIRKAIDSILVQSYSYFKLIILDDASTDNTWKIINRYNDARVTKIKNDINIGYLKSINKLFSLCKTKYIAFQDADDWSHPDRFKLQIELLNREHSISFCGSNCMMIYNNFQKIKSYPEHNKYIQREILRGNTSIFCGASIFFKKNLLLDIGYYNILFNRIGAEDIEWQLRILKQYKGANIQQPLYYYRQHENSLTSTTDHRNTLKQHSSEIALFISLLDSEAKRNSEIKNIEKFIEYYYSNITVNHNQSMLEQALKKNITQLHNIHNAIKQSNAYNLNSRFIYYISLNYILLYKLIPDFLVKKMISRRRLIRVKKMLKVFLTTYDCSNV